MYFNAFILKNLFCAIMFPFADPVSYGNCVPVATFI